jgi:hypothetical protein
MVVPHVAKEPLFLNRTGSRSLGEGRIVAFIGVPIKLGRETVGVLSVDREVDSAPMNFEGLVRFLAMIANLIGQTARLHQNVVAEREELMQRQQRRQKELQGKYSLDNVIGRSKRMQEIFAEVHQASPGKSAVLLRGESGNGKEVIARSILLRQNFTTLYDKNNGNMKWKKFFYKQLCDRAEMNLCKAPSGQVCSDYRQCFGPEDAGGLSPSSGAGGEVGHETHTA